MTKTITLVVRPGAADLQSPAALRACCEKSFDEGRRRLDFKKESLVGVLQGLTFPAGSSEEQRLEWNSALSELYRKFQWPILGGDTSSGAEFLLTLTLIFTP